jgi:SAM-dependent methyltransferase
MARRIRNSVWDRLHWLRAPPQAGSIPVHLLSAAEIATFVEVGDRFLKYFVELGGLRPEHAVLEVGCGSGRMARPLTAYLTSGTYDGFDVMVDDVRWCRRAISAQYSNFRFQVADVHNGLYNPSGRSSAANYRFPFEDARFDFVFLTSVFTHLVPEDLENYLREIVRVMKPGARCLVTFFLLNAQSRELIRVGRSSFPFTDDRGRYATVRGESTEWAIAYDENYVWSLFDASNLSERDVRYGNWCSRTHALDYQDLVFATKGRSSVA